MEKTLELVLNDEITVVSKPEEFFEGDYKDISDVLNNIENRFLREYVEKKYGEYIKLGFPKWKRLKLERINLPKYRYVDYFKDVDFEIDLIDFEGANRKFVLLSDIFSSKGEYLKVKEKKEIFKEYEDEITNDYYQVEDELTVVRILRTNDFSNNTLRFELGDNAKLNLYNIHVTKDSSFSVDNVFIWTKNNSKVVVKDVYIGSGKIAGYLGVKMGNKNANVQIKPYFLGKNSAIFDLLYLLRFVGIENKGSIRAEGALMDSAKVVFRGILDLRRGAKNSEAEEFEKCILLSKNSKMEAIPSLLVDENEVVASHAASSAPLDENSVFYLMSRGFSEKEAKRYILNGIFETLVEELTIYGVEGLIKDALEEYTG
ncbi:Fe-S cluster assembly protein SufD [Thermosipho melanesiensis]|uniref:SufBD protein n=2 Tax=Thermosipho melanesiensis TaxID=46541 RepID=A6LJ27_THEM4|nr:SufD family Fe-S cluster assembly protein [Thermosipho melanesiensis]ABR29928.1 SufBD protein [Thermosipho melanesiensis BI429]APT73136.1 Fe-S cluster assembly protein SufD [Thermosipho melanesiensis]OOC38533.1 Fe-S cluster assembly protein SufD [Thermosipho melanesiensis]OOC40337.1 Fe-S cluster assembly protein SufD [Thermosipho melanesiensis]OOC40601.1 Fe-S cluster assembly protein SufD [Thermosipho melanesiensis]